MSTAVANVPPPGGLPNARVTMASTGGAHDASRQSRPARARLARLPWAILLLWGTFFVALCLIRVLEQLALSASGANAGAVWVPVVASWLYVGALACVSAALVLAICSAVGGGHLQWVAALLLLDGPFAFLLINGLLGGPFGGAGGSVAAFVGYHQSLSALSLVGTPVGIVGCLVSLRSVGRRRPLQQVLVALLALALIYSLVGLLLEAGAEAVPLARRPSPLDTMLPYFIPGNQTAYFGHFTPVLLYALATVDTVERPLLRGSTHGPRSIALLALVPLVLLNFIALRASLLGAGAGGADGGSNAAFGSVYLDAVSAVGLCCAAGVSLLVANWALRRAVRRRQWAWLATMVLVAAALSFSLVFTYLPISGPWWYAVLASSLVGWLGADGAAMIYGLWG